jgi:hypothetical protein
MNLEKLADIGFAVFVAILCVLAVAAGAALVITMWRVALQ